MRAFPHTDTVRNPLEAGVLIRQRNALFISNLAQHLTRYDGLHEVVLRTHLSEAFHRLDVVVSEHHAGLVSVDNRPFAILIAANDSQTVSIRVAGNHKVGIQFRSQVHSHRHRLCVLGIRAHHRREVAVNHHLLGHHVDILETPRTQAHWHNLTTCTMQRRIDDVQVFLAQNHILVHHAGLHCLHIGVVHLATDNLNQVFVRRPFHIVHRYLVHLVNDTLVMRLEHLRTIFPIRLVTVVLARVVACRYIHTTLAFQLANGKTNLRRRTQTLKQIHLDTVGGENIRYRLCEQPTVVAAVVPYHNGYLTVLHVLEAVLCLHFQQVVGIALRSLRYDVLVHTIGARTHDTAQTARTELQCSVETIHEFCLVLGFHHCFHLCLGLGIVFTVQPTLGNGHHLL